MAHLVDALRYKSEGLGFDFDRTITMGLTQLVSEMKTKSICWEVNVADALGFATFL